MTSQMQNQAGKATISSIGATGSVAVTGTGAITPPTGSHFFAIQFISDSVVAARTDLTGATNANIVTISSFGQGTVIYGKWSSITLTSGTAIGYTTTV